MPFPTPRLDEIRASDWQLRIGEPGAIVEGQDDVDQCIRTILLTPRGSVPFDPEFGSDVWRYLDAPLTTVRPYLLRAILEAVQRWEPRAEITQVDVSLGDDGSGLLVRIERRLSGSSADAGILTVEIDA